MWSFLLSLFLLSDRTFGTLLISIQKRKFCRKKLLESGSDIEDDLVVIIPVNRVVASLLI